MPEGMTDRTQRRSLELLKSLSEEQLKLHPDESELAARIESYDLAYRMQTEAMSLVDLGRESEARRAMDGLDDRRHVSDLHATILHLMGIDHTRLSYLHQGLKTRLTGVEERRVMTKVLA